MQRIKEVIIIRAADPDGSMFRAIMDALRGRRAEVIELAAPSHDILTFGDIAIYPDRRTVLKAGEEVRLNHGEFSMLLLLASAPLWDHRGREYHLAAAAEVRGRSQAPGLHQDGHPKRI